MDMKSFSICFFFWVSLFMHSMTQAQTGLLADKPPMGWNSFNSYGVYCYEAAAFANLEAMNTKLKPYGYVYFVIDNGWFGEYELEENTHFSVERHASDIHINEYGLFEPSRTYFPNGFKSLIDSCHAKGLKFGLHLMRGIPRKAVLLNTPVKGTDFRAADIADTLNVCSWCTYNYGIDMDKPGAQAYYNSLISHLAGWGVDFIKYDDIVPYPREVEAIVKAIEQCGRPIVLSLSPGDKVEEKDLPALRKANMLRVTADIWDTQHCIDLSFDAWKRWQGKEEPGFWPDLDMIPFGELQLMSPPGRKTKDQKEIALAGRGTHRWSELNESQKYTFITQRSMAASPLFYGGNIVSIDDFTLRLLTNKDMLACNQNGVVGNLIYEENGIEVWTVKERDRQAGWIGIFNPTQQTQSRRFVKEELGLAPEKDYRLLNIWEDRKSVSLDKMIEIPGNGVLFIRYE